MLLSISDKIGPYDDIGNEGIFHFTIAVSKPALGPTQPLTQWVPGALSTGLKRPGRETYHSPPSSTEIKKAWRYTSTPPYITWRGS
jgi:hypothetical protein